MNKKRSMKSFMVLRPVRKTLAVWGGMGWILLGATTVFGADEAGSLDFQNEELSENKTVEAKEQSHVAEPAENFMKANDAYEAGEYGRATRLYEELVAAGYPSGALYYNLGNSYLRVGALGKAIANYRKSQGMRPRDADLKANLSFARKNVKDAIAPPQAAPLLRTLFFWHYTLSLRELIYIVSILNVLFWIALSCQLFRRESEILRWMIPGTLILLVALGSSLLVRAMAPNGFAVVLQEEVDVHSGRSKESVIRFKLHEGTEAKVKDIQGGWVRILLSDGKQGWVQEKNVDPFYM